MSGRNGKQILGMSALAIMLAAGGIVVGQSVTTGGSSVAGSNHWAATPVVVVNDLVPRPGILQVGDLVNVTIWSLISAGQGETFELHVSEEGLSVPLVGVVRVRGLTNDRAAAEISSELARQNVLRDAVVTVSISKTASETRVRPGAIDAGDGLRVSVFDLAGQRTRSEVLVLVSEDGTITLPLAGTITVRGMTEAEADGAVKLAYREKNVFQSPMVSVLRLDQTGRP